MKRAAALWAGAAVGATVGYQQFASSLAEVAAAPSNPGGRKFEGETLRVQFWAGPEGNAIQKHAVVPFMDETGAKVVTELGRTADSIAKLRGQRADPQVDVIMMDDVGVITTVAEGLLEPIDLARIPNAANVHRKFIYAKGHGLGIGISVNAALWYNTRAFPRAPTSWQVLFDPKYKGKVSMPSIEQTAMLYLLILFARMNGGSQLNIDRGFAALSKMKDNIHSFGASSQLVASGMESGEIVLAASNLARLRPYLLEGYKIDFNPAPKEGVLSGPPGISIVKGHKAKREVIDAFIDRVISPEAQVGISTETWWGPTNSKVKLPPDVAKRVLHTPAQIEAIMPVNLDHLLLVREQWIDRFNKTIGR